MSDEVSKRDARTWLSDRGYVVTDIPVAEGERRADVVATWQTEELAVEAKGKAETQFWLNLLDQARTRGQASASRSVGQWNTISSVIRDANEQLVSTPLSESTLRVMWVLAEHLDGSFVLEMFEKRLFGHRDLTCVPYGVGGLPPVSVRRCYFYDASDFLRFKQLDAVVLSTGSSMRLCVNPFSVRRDALGRSRLLDIFQKEGVVTDPGVEERGGRAMQIDEVVAQGQRHQYLKQRYGVGTSPMIEEQFVGILALQRERLAAPGY